jgi:iron(III) transport system permease protein
MPIILNRDSSRSAAAPALRFMSPAPDPVTADLVVPVNRTASLPRGRLASADPLRLVAILIALVTAAPVLALFVVAAGESEVAGTIPHLASTVLPGYVFTTALLALLVLGVALLFGVSCGWLVARYRFPGHRVVSWALVLPLAMPGFVMAYAYTDFLDTSGPFQGALRAATGWGIGDYWFPDIRTTVGAGLFLGLALYPYVYLFARPAFAETSPTMTEAARSLGLSGRAVWWRVTWPVARPAIVAGSLLVLMETLADFGVVSYFSVDAFTAGIYRAWQGMGDRVGAARLAIVLLAFVATVVWIERRQRGRMRFFARGGGRMEPDRVPTARGLRMLAWCLVPIVFGFALPALLLLTGWLSDGGAVDARLPRWVGNTALIATVAAFATMPVALLAAYAARVHADRATRWSLLLANSGYALPGVVIGVGLLAFVGVFDAWVSRPLLGIGLFGGTVVAVVYAYGVRFFSVAYQGLGAALERISPSMDQSARCLGRNNLGVLRDVHWPMLRRSLAAAGLVVVIECLKELPATLVLRPFNFDTLAVVAYQFASDERLAEAALPSLLIVVVGMVPVLLLARTMSRR